jgi:hypothetical protein
MAAHGDAISLSLEAVKMLVINSIQSQYQTRYSNQLPRVEIGEKQIFKR